MIKIDFTGRKILTFHVQIFGTNGADLRGTLKIVDPEVGVEYCIEGKISGSKVTVKIPPLNTIFARKVANDTVFKIYLEVFGGVCGLYSVPWTDELLVKSQDVEVVRKETQEDKVVQIVKPKETNLAEKKIPTKIQQPVLETEVKREKKIPSNGKTKDKLDTPTKTETKIHSIIREMQKFNALTEADSVVEDIVKEIIEEPKLEPKSEPKKKEKVKTKKKKILKESKKVEKKPEPPKKDKQRHEKKVMATLLSVSH